MTVRPVPEHAGLCPRDDAPLAAERFQLIGTRWLVRGRCTGACGHTWLQDLPTGHGLLYPTSLDLDTGDGFGVWFTHLLAEGARAPDTAPVDLRVERVRGARDVVVLPCLDFVYGHALLRLLNAQRHLDAGEDVVVVVPAALAHLVPNGVAERWVLHEPLSRLRGWLAALDEQTAAEFDRFATVHVSPAFPHPHPSTWDLARFTGPLEAERAGSPSIVWVERSDRLWGGSADAQAANVAGLWEAVRAEHPGAAGALVGVGTAGGAPDGMTDLRSEQPDEALERRWLAFLAGADVAIGAHGSSLLLPSGLAAATVELLPADRWAHFGQATLLADRDPLGAFLRHRAIPGDDDLSDVTPDRVAAFALSLLGDDRDVMLGPAAGVGTDLPQGFGRTRPFDFPTESEPGLLDRVAAALRRGERR